MAHPTRRFNRWIFEGMFLEWGALMSLVPVAVLAVVGALTPEPTTFIVVLVVITLVVALAPGCFRFGEPHTLTRGSPKPLSRSRYLRAVPGHAGGRGGPWSTFPRS